MKFNISLMKRAGSYRTFADTRGILINACTHEWKGGLAAHLVFGWEHGWD